MIKMRSHPDPVAKQGAKIKRRCRVNSQHSHFFSLSQKYINDTVYQGAFTCARWARNTDNRAAFIKLQAFKQCAAAIKIILNDS